MKQQVLVVILLITTAFSLSGKVEASSSIVTNVTF